MKNTANRSLKSYSPYSKTEESCFVQGATGMFYPGVRVENISFPLSISAVQSAICSCLANDDIPRVLYQNEPCSELTDYWQHEYKLELQENFPDEIDVYDPLITDIRNISGFLFDLCKNAITIHSGFPVSVLLATHDGYIPGVNVEISSWSLGLCAERVALSRAIASGYQGFKKIHIYAPKSEFCSPCGACRQVLYELMPDKTVLLHHQTDSLTKHFVHHLLPHAFMPGSLKSKQDNRETEKPKNRETEKPKKESS